MRPHWILSVQKLEDIVTGKGTRIFDIFAIPKAHFCLKTGWTSSLFQSFWQYNSGGTSFDTDKEIE